MADLTYNEAALVVTIADETANVRAGILPGTNNALYVSITDGVNAATVTASGQLRAIIDNAAGAAAVNIQDGGNSITVDGTVTANQGTPAVVANAWPIKVVDSGGVNVATVDATGALKVTLIDQHTVDSAGDTYVAGTTKGVVADARVVTTSPTLTAGQFSGLTITTAGELRALQTGNISLDAVAGRGFVLATNLVTNGAGNGTDLGILFISNPLGSGKNIQLKIMTLGALTNNRAVFWKLFQNPTGVAGGTQTNPLNISLGFVATSVTNTLSRIGNLTQTTTGTLWTHWVTSQNGTVGPIDLQREMILPPNTSILFTARGIGGTSDVAMSLEWYEVV